MQSKSESVNQEESNLNKVPNSTACSEPWWNNTGHNSISSAIKQGTASNSSSLEQSVGGESQSEDRTNQEDDDTANKSPKISNGQEDSTIQHVPPTLDSRNKESIIQAQPSQPELVGHSIAHAPNPYDPYYVGMMAAYGPPVVPSQIYDMNQTRMPLPLDMALEPVYVNAKQYHGILRRRQSRAKAELEKKLIKVRKPYLHESRHQHALRRERGSGGRFAKKSDNDTPNPKEKGSNSSAFSESSKVSEARNMFRNQTNTEELAHGEGHMSSQQWGNITSNRALAMQ